MEDNDVDVVIALTWFLHNACTSNVELAIVSNVCRRWREVAAMAVVAVVAADGNGNGNGGGRKIIDAPSLTSEPSLQFASSTMSIHPLHSSCIQRLLISDMARELVVVAYRQAKQCKQDKSQNSGKQLTGRGNTNTEEGNFCLAWFAPSGIQTISVSVDDGADDEIDCIEENNPPEFNERGKHKLNEKQTNGRKKDKTGNHVICCPEWRGYRHATEVLFPFGYATCFIKNVLDASLSLVNSSSTLEASNKRKTTKLVSHEYNPTFAVRGATLARPEGFCLCLDNDYIECTNSPSFQLPSHASSHSVPCCIDKWMNDYDERNQLQLRRNRVLSPHQRQRKQNQLAKVLLPRVVLSTRRKYPLLHRFAEVDAHENETERQPLAWEKRQQAVQFLNSDKSQAVKLITPSFDCGPTSGPITMFVVGITTEDGCFVSGRSSRFELGHLYPLSARDMQSDMSPISMATGKGNAINHASMDLTDDSIGAEHQFCSALKIQETSSDEEDSSSTDSERSVHCLCKFDSVDPFNRTDHSVEQPTEGCIHRGCTGPCLWHCYSAIFDGVNSLIHVDGCIEPKRTREHYGLSIDEDDDNDDADNISRAGRFVGSGFLDGLSIGSDHLFDMSLCYGEIEGVCGQGAIAELAVFKGRLDERDIKKLEKNLMDKHGILSVEEREKFVASENSARMKPINIACHLQEDEWRRQAHALIEQGSPWTLDGSSVPLRVAANHPSVAWHRTNEITGSQIKTPRIGAKNGNGSSDW